MTEREKAARALGAVTSLAGAALAAFPYQIGTFTCRSSKAPRASIIRVLGGRYVVQGLAEAAWPTGSMLKTACAVDVLHAASMVATASVSREYRRASSVSLMLAVTSAVCAAVLARNGR